MSETDEKYRREIKLIADDLNKVADRSDWNAIEDIVDRLTALSLRINIENDISIDYETTKNFIIDVCNYSRADTSADCFSVAYEFKKRFTKLFQFNQSDSMHFNRDFLSVVIDVYYEGNPVGFGKLLDIWEGVMHHKPEQNVYGDFVMSDKIRFFITSVVFNVMQDSSSSEEDVSQLFYEQFAALFANCIGDDMSTGEFEDEFIKIANHVCGRFKTISFEKLLNLWMDTESSDNESNESVTKYYDVASDKLEKVADADTAQDIISNGQRDMISNLIDTIIYDDIMDSDTAKDVAVSPERYIKEFRFVIDNVGLSVDCIERVFNQIVLRDYVGDNRELLFAVFAGCKLLLQLQ